ncbi:hypothetical protein DI53_3659 [Sphingobacterium deserti]|uniref:Uncharacterized protein n=1 Tax=Sphingobacterium deserti TaxID=1229276 RepID=A0A0B8T574_9SPHI|nr:hypothetical protein DI53_3659 [Sphingobacterium deserti]
MSRVRISYKAIFLILGRSKLTFYMFLWNPPPVNLGGRLVICFLIFQDKFPHRAQSKVLDEYKDLLAGTLTENDVANVFFNRMGHTFKSV